MHILVPALLFGGDQQAAFASITSEDQEELEISLFESGLFECCDEQVADERFGWSQPDAFGESGGRRTSRQLHPLLPQDHTGPADARPPGDWRQKRDQREEKTSAHSLV